jgi:hypothetical protein
MPLSAVHLKIYQKGRLQCNTCDGAAYVYREVGYTDLFTFHKTVS